MQCPVCKDVKLTMAERKGIEIDYCPNCRGIWLDRGELDKIIERSAEASPDDNQWDRHRDRSPDDYDSRPRDYGRYGKKRKRRGFLGELFDFD